MVSTHSDQSQIMPSNSMSEKPITEPFVSVIIPVYNDTKRLQICLAALEQQTYRPDCYEIVVVDNGSDPDQDVGAIATQCEHVVVIKELAPGSYAARNKGISVARGDVIAFTDADCIPSSTWLETGVNYLLENPDCGLVAGKIEMFFDDPDNVSVVELYDHVVMGFPQEEFVKRRKAGMTANIFTRKPVIDKVGIFRAHLKSQGDLEWGARVFEAGFQQIYAEDVCVAHPTRKSLREICRRTLRLAGGVYDIYVTQESSMWKRNKRFVRLVADDLVLRVVGTTKSVLRDERLGGVSTRIKVLGIIYLMKSISAYEKIRLRLGGRTQRG